MNVCVSTLLSSGMPPLWANQVKYLVIYVLDDKYFKVDKLRWFCFISRTYLFKFIFVLRSETYSLSLSSSSSYILPSSPVFFYIFCTDCLPFANLENRVSQ